LPGAIRYYQRVLTFTLLPPEMLTLLIALALIAAAYDIRYRRIPNWLNVSGVAAGICMNAFLSGWAGLRLSLGGLALSFAAYFLLYAVRAVGAGDVKLMAALGAVAGWQDWVGIFIGAAVAGGLASLIVIARRRRVNKTLLNVRFVVSEMKSGRAAHLRNEELDVRSAKSVGLPHGAVIAAGTLLFLAVSAHFAA
jgi:prepilin peptidase CpaA